LDTAVLIQEIPDKKVAIIFYTISPSKNGIEDMEKLIYLFA